MDSRVNHIFDPSAVDLLAECSWEVCNKIGGIYTVLSTKAVELKKMFDDRLVFVGPDFTGEKGDANPLFKERKSLLKYFSSKTLPFGIKVRVGRWNIPGSPLVILVNFHNVFPSMNEIYGRMWERFGVDSLHSYGDYDESCAFSVACAVVIMELGAHLKADPSRTIAHFNEWTTGMGLLYLKDSSPSVATVFTTHATTVGRSICGNGKPLYQYFPNYDGDQMARELNVESKHSLEKAAAWQADCFTTVSDVTARECAQLLGKYPDVVTPNGFEPSFVPDSEKWERLRKEARKRILGIASLLWDKKLGEDTLIVATSGRNEFRNKGLDIFLDSMRQLAGLAGSDGSRILALVLVPAWVRQPSGDLLVDMDFGGWIKPSPDYLTHRLHNEDTDSVAAGIRRLQAEMNGTGEEERLKFVFVPSYLDGCDGIVNISYYDFLPGVDITVFGSYYEPWGYTPLESIAFGVPTVTTDKAGFGQWARRENVDSLMKDGVAVINREDTNYWENAREIARIVNGYRLSEPSARQEASQGAMATSSLAEWKFFMEAYREAFGIAQAKAEQRISR